MMEANTAHTKSNSKYCGQDDAVKYRRCGGGVVKGNPEESPLEAEHHHGVPQRLDVAHFAVLR